MDTALNEEELMIRDSARRLLETASTPKLVRAMQKDTLGYPADLWRQAAEMGWQGICLPADFGGSELGLTSLGLVMEEIGRALAPLPLLATSVTVRAIDAHGTDAQREEILPAVASGDLILTFAFQEADPRLTPQAVKLSARASGEGFVLTGEKLFVEYFEAARKVLVAARTADATPSGAGLTLFLVDTDAMGLSSEPLVTLAKDRVSRLRFDGVHVAADRMVGPLHGGWPIAERVLDEATALLCAEMVGAARKDAEMAVEWSKVRKAFGKPIGAFQSLQHMCADALIWVDGGWLLTYEALWRLDQGLPAQVEVSQAKAFCNEKCQAAVRISQVIHGGMGFMMEFDLHLWYQRVAAWTTRLGSAFEHRARIAAALLDQPGKVVLGRPVPVTETV